MNVLSLVLAAAAVSGGTVTIPLSEAPQLLNPAPKEAGKPPVDALLVEQSLTASPGPDGLTVDARFVVRVLAEESWSKLSLMPLGPDVVVTSVHGTDGSVFAPHDGHLVFIAKAAAEHILTAKLLVRTKADGAGRVASFAGPAGLVPLTVQADPAIFDLEETGQTFATGGRYVVRWRPRAEPTKTEKREPPPPLEPRIDTLLATWVTTLEGRVTERLTYTLALDRAQPFEVTVPEGQTVESVRVNGQVVPVTANGRVVKLEVAPKRLGETAATVELRLTENIGVFHLAGKLRVTLPAASWQASVVSLRAYLPEVFEYRREGGSLEAGQYGGSTSEVLPGREWSFRQFLVTASSPSVELGYSVNITKSYFR